MTAVPTVAGGPIGVLVMAYGSPRSHDEIEPYYTDIRRGRPPTPEQLADLVDRYDAIGGLSPLAARTEAQRAAIEMALEACDPGRYVVRVGLRHAAPSIEDAVATLAADGVSAIVGLVLAPHFSSFSVAAYQERAEATAGVHGLTFTGIDSWATEPAYVAFLAGVVAAGLAELPPGSKVVFTAHSLPARIVAIGDRYPSELAATALAVARAAGLEPWQRWSTAWQSAGRTPEPWLGPDVLTVVDTLAAQGGAGLLVCPCGFVSDHLEVLYDLDIQAAERAARQGLPFARTAVVNDDPAVMAALAERIAAAADPAMR